VSLVEPTFFRTNFTSQLAQYANPEIAPVAQLVEQKLEALVAQATGAGQETHADIGGDFR